SALLLLPRGAIVAHVGDSRVYRLRGAQLDQLSFDHSLVWELTAAGQVAAGNPAIPRNIITRSLGPNPDVEVDLEGPFPVTPGDAARRGGMHPFVWIAMGLSVIVAGVLAAWGQPVPALIAGAAGVVLSLVLNSVVSRGKDELPRARLGRGPHRTYNCQLELPF